MTVGKALRTELQARGWSQVEGAEHLGVTAQAISEWVRDKQLPSAKYIPAVAKFLKVNTEQLVAMMHAEDPPARLARLEEALTRLADAQQSMADAQLETQKLQGEMRDLLEQALRRRR